MLCASDAWGCQGTDDEYKKVKDKIHMAGLQIKQHVAGAKAARVRFAGILNVSDVPVKEEKSKK